MSEHESLAPVGLERLTAAEKKQYDDFRSEFIAVAQIFEAQGIIHLNKEGKLMMPIQRVEILKDLVQKTGLSFDQLDPPFRHALQVEDMVSIFFPDAQVAIEKEEIFVPSERPKVANEADIVPHSTISLEEDRIRKEIDTLISTIKVIRAKGVNSPRLKVLCLEVTNLCRPYHGVEQYTGDADFAHYVQSCLSPSPDFGKKSVDQKKTPVPPPPPNSSETLHPGETSLQRMARKIGELFAKK